MSSARMVNRPPPASPVSVAEVPLQSKPPPPSTRKGRTTVLARVGLKSRGICSRSADSSSRLTHSEGPQEKARSTTISGSSSVESAGAMCRS